MSLVHLDDKNFDELVIKSNLPVLVDFFAEWCGPCKMAAPILEELGKDFEGKIKVGKLDVDAAINVAGKYGVQSIPTVIMFKDGKEVERKVGFGGRSPYEELIKKVL